MLLGGGMLPRAGAQIHVAPPAVYLDTEQTTGRIEVLNTGSRAAEITVDIGYGYPETDDSGDLRMTLLESIPDHAPSAADWIQIYPYRFTLPAGLRQTIRFGVLPPDTLNPGEYWARPLISARTSPERLSSASDKLHARLNVVQRSILALNYRHGPVHTVPVLDSVGIRRTPSELRVQPYLRRTGNAASLGNLLIKLENTEGKDLILQKKHDIAVYYNLNRSVRFPLEDVPPGSYRVTIEVNSDRIGSNPGDILPFEPVRWSRSLML